MKTILHFLSDSPYAPAYIGIIGAAILLTIAVLVTKALDKAKGNKFVAGLEDAGKAAGSSLSR